MKIYVDANAKHYGDGTEEWPFQTIQAAAEVANPGDEVLVLPGVYHEQVDPQRGGTEEQPIVYRSVEPLGATITGAEVIKNWESVGDGVWTTRIPNGLFGDYNPYKTLVQGDWFDGRIVAHTGEVFLNDKALYEVNSLDEVKQPKPFNRSWDVDFTVYTWFTEQDRMTDGTVLYANFHDFDPNEETVEITVRRRAFFPSQSGLNYITLDGFVITKAASQWAPPTAFQDGMVGPHWSKGWVIENNDISHAKTNGISLGKYLQPNNDNNWSKYKRKDGTQTQREVVIQATYEGWDKEHVGSHVVRNNHIHDNGQTGIVGHMGCAFSLIEDNEIDHNNVRQNLVGAETGGIKFHAPIDTVIRHNHIHHNNRGIWLDWQVQGTRITRNIFHDNTLAKPFETNDDTLDGLLLGLGEDLWIEVSHGPTLVDNNLMLSERSLRLAAQGVSLVHNLLAGSIAAVGRGTNNNSINVPSDRYTPYHEAHGTKIIGFMSFLHGDDRFYNNIFVQSKLRPELQKLADRMKDNPDEWDDYNFVSGTKPFDGFPKFEDWDKYFDGYVGLYAPNNDRYYGHLPVWAGGNVYFNGAQAYDGETPAHVDDEHEIKLELVETDEGLKLDTNLFDFLPTETDAVISTATLGEAFEPEERFENPDGTEIIFDRDFFGHRRAGSRVTAGPFADRDSLSLNL